MKCLSTFCFRRKREEDVWKRKFLASYNTTSDWTEPFPWYLDDSHLDRVLTPEMRSYYSNITGLKGDELNAKLCSIRDRAYKEGHFPEHGGFWFLRDTFRRHPAYSRLLASLKLGATLADLSGGLHEELRYLAADGAPTDKMWAIGTRPKMWEISKELFGEDALNNSRPGGESPLRPPFKARYINKPVEFMYVPRDCKPLSGKADLIIANHIFTYISDPDNRRIFTTANQMSKPGTVFMGMQIGCTRAFVSDDDQFFLDNRNLVHEDFRNMAKIYLNGEPRDRSDPPAQDWKVVVHQVVDLQSWGLLEQEWEWIKPRDKTTTPQMHGVFWALERVK